LWKTKSKDYIDKNKKNAAYQILLEHLKTVQAEVTKNAVKQKINSLRTGFRREFKKFKEKDLTLEQMTSMFRHYGTTS
jgi:competence protein ComGF